MYYDDTDARIDEYIISKHEKEQMKEEETMLTVNYKTSDNDDNVNNNNTNEVNEMSENKKVAVVFVAKNGKMSKPMMAVEDVAAAVGTYWRDLYAKEDHPKSKTSKKGARRLQTKTIKNPSHVKELGVASGKLAPRVTYNKIYNIRGWNSEHHRKTKALFEAAEVRYYDEVKKRPISYDEAMAKTKVQDAKTIIVAVDKPVVDKPVSLFAQAEDAKPLEIKVDLNTDKRHPGFDPSDGYTFEEMMSKLEQERQEGLKRLIDDLRAFDWYDDGLPITKKDDKAKALEAVRKAKQEIEAAEKLLENK